MSVEPKTKFGFNAVCVITSACCSNDGVDSPILLTTSIVDPENISSTLSLKLSITLMPLLRALDPCRTKFSACADGSDSRASPTPLARSRLFWTIFVALGIAILIS